MTTTETNISNTGKTREEAAARGTSVEELADRLSTTSGMSDDTAMFLATNWQKVLGALAVILLFSVLINLYQTNKSRRLGEASARFETAIADYHSLTTADSKATDDAAKNDRDNKRRALVDGLDILRDNYSGTTYGDMSILYLAANQAAEGKFDESQKSLEKFGVGSYQKITVAKNGKDAAGSKLIDELAAIQFARLQLRRSPAQPDVAKATLTGLVYGGRFLHFEALLALYRLAQTPEEQANVQEITRNLFAARPELRELVSSQLQAEGYAVKD